MVKFSTLKLYTKRAEMNLRDKGEFEKKMTKQMEKEEEIQKSEIFSIVCETGLESNFQFWFQTQYYMPVLVTNILDYTDITELFNWRVFSIVLSFVSISWTAVKIRNVFNLVLS